jgi:hypothetical protein
MKYLSIILLILVFLTITFRNVYAHILKTDGSIGAVMHVTPEDDPIAGERSDFYFEFKDRNNKFKPENCDCIISILRSGKEIFSQPLFASNTDPSLSNASLSFTFPQKDVYKIKVAGKPKSPGAFIAFTLEYDLRVARVTEGLDSNGQAPAAEPEQKNWFLPYLPFLLGGFIAIAFLIWVVLKKRIIS